MSNYTHRVGVLAQYCFAEGTKPGARKNRYEGRLDPNSLAVSTRVSREGIDLLTQAYSAQNFEIVEDIEGKAVDFSMQYNFEDGSGYSNRFFIIGDESEAPDGGYMVAYYPHHSCDSSAGEYRFAQSENGDFHFQNMMDAIEAATDLFLSQCAGIQINGYQQTGGFAEVQKLAEDSGRKVLTFSDL